jgi:mannose/fructose/N-acetylgalactosamine-specific phosphotransferase system component IIC
MIWKILGAALALWFVFMAVGWFVAMLKTFLIIGLAAVAVVLVVWLLAKRRHKNSEESEGSEG